MRAALDWDKNRIEKLNQSPIILSRHFFLPSVISKKLISSTLELIKKMFNL